MLEKEIYYPMEFDPAVFRPDRPDITPQELFPECVLSMRQFPDFAPYRFVMEDPRYCTAGGNFRLQLIYTDGACSDNGRAGAVGGIGFAVCNEGRSRTHGAVRYPLELEGPDGVQHAPTNNRAELRAVIAALEFRQWYREGWNGVVIATDSTYVSKGAIEWVLTWATRGWRTAGGGPVANKDLWLRLLRLFRDYAIHGCAIMMWWIPRKQISLADRLAKIGASKAATGSFPERWVSWGDKTLFEDRDFDF